MDVESTRGAKKEKLRKQGRAKKKICIPEL